MRKSYKIFGTFWDGVDFGNGYTIANDCNFVLNHRNEKNLLDYDNHYNRSIDFSELLSIEKESDFLDIIKDIQDCDGIFINIDYMPHSLNDTIADFLNLRLSQMIYRIKCELPNISVKVIQNKSLYCDKQQ